MRVRYYGLLVLAAVGIVPLAIFGYYAITEAEATAMAEVREGNARVARSVAHEIGTYVESERKLLVAAGESALQAEEAEEAQALLDAFSLSHPHVNDLAVYRPEGEKFAGRAAYDELVQPALGGASARSGIRQADDGFAHQLTMAEPVVVAGKQEGAVVARVDLVDLWAPVGAVTVGETGFIRLLGPEGELLAHGDPEERRGVFDPDRAVDEALLVGAYLGEIVQNQQGQDVVATVSYVPSLDSFVVVEQTVAEAFAAVASTRRSLYLFGAGALVVAAAVGLIAGGAVVRPLEKLRAHTRTLGSGDLDARAEPDSRLVEVRDLASSLDEMAADLKRLQEEAKQRERLTTFGRVAAGLAHDLKQPIVALRMGCDAALKNPHDEQAQRMLEVVATKDLPRLDKFVADLRRLAKRGEMELEVEPLHPGELVREIAEELSDSPKWQGVTFEASGDAEVLDADPGLVRRALVNLASNGADACLEKARDGGHIELQVGDADGGEAVEFRVSDNGTGIDPSRVPDLLSSDFKSTKRSTGVGLGLGVVRQVAESHGGRLSIESDPGEGSTFTLRVPRTRVSRSPNGGGDGQELRSQGERHAERSRAGAG